MNVKGGKSYEEDLSNLVINGFTFNGKPLAISERSASMTRLGMLSFIDHTIEQELDERISMGLHIGKTVLSKWYAYRGLMLSSCHCLENWYPKIIIVPDCFKTVCNQNIKYVYDKDVSYTGKDGNEHLWKQKAITEGCKDVEINAFDGTGIHHPAITQLVKEKLHSDTSPTSILWRAPYIKGVTHEMDYPTFFAEHGISAIKDIWGVSHCVAPDSEPMIIMCESMYKGLKYFKHFGDIRDWEDYWVRFKKYEHCIGIAKWNFSNKEEPVYTRANYQVLQDLELPYDKFALLAKDSVDWAEKIASGDFNYTMCFLGMFADNCKPINNYVKAVLKNPEMLKEIGVRNYFVSLIKKQMDDMKCGKLLLKSNFKFLAPDLIMLMQHIAGLQTNGCLEHDEFYSCGKNGVYSGEYLIERNPHICKSEHTILKAVNNHLLEKYCSHLANVCMINSKSITPQRMNGADFDGDLVLVIDNEIMKNGVDRSAAVVIDVDDKITVEPEEDTKSNKLKIILRTMNSLIGETSNCATAYHNKTPKTSEKKKVYGEYIDLLSVINGKSIDFAKTGILFNIPRNIAKFGRPLPYFMRYRNDYYKNMNELSRSNSNMNRLCWELERWDRTIRWKRTYHDFDYHIMIDNQIKQDAFRYSQIEKIYLDFCKEMSQLKIDQKEIQEDFEFSINWNYYYDNYKSRCNTICRNQKELANIAVRLCYEQYPNKTKKFMWRIAGDGILENLVSVPIKLPLENENGSFEYLGKTYSLADRINVNTEEV